MSEFCIKEKHDKIRDKKADRQILLFHGLSFYIMACTASMLLNPWHQAAMRETKDPKVLILEAMKPIMGLKKPRAKCQMSGIGL